MTTTNPTLLTMPIAKNGNKNAIPATTSTTGAMSQSLGFPPETSLPLGAGGVAPSREDFNGAFNFLSNIAFYAQKGWTFEYDENQDYYKRCIIIDPDDGKRYECVADMVAGTVAPHADSAGDYWKEFTLGGGVPIGTIFAYGGSTNPEGALLCNGAAVSRTMYADLFDVIGTKYGSGDGTTTFNLPQRTDAITAGAISKTTYETAGSATFTAPKSGLYRITVKGAGGGGANGAYSSNSKEGGAGGGEGGTTIGFEHLDAGDSVSVVVGAGGTGGSTGGNGGDSTVTVNLNTYTGGGGTGAKSASDGQAGAGGTGTIPGAPGCTGVTQDGSSSTQGGAGGGNGGGYSGRSISGANGVLGGGGAGGSGSSYSSNRNGGAGGDGYVWIEFLGDAEAFYIQAFNASTDPALVDLTQILQDLANRLTREQTPAFNHRDVVTTSGTYTAPVTGWYKITAKGGGGGGLGGGVASGGFAYASGGGGEGGTTIAYEHMNAGDTATVTVGAGGAGSAIRTTPATDGGDSSVVIGANTYTGGGGKAGTRNGGAGGTGTVYGASGGTGAGDDAIGSGALVSVQGGVGGGNGGGIGANGDTDTATAGVNGGGGGGGGATTNRSYSAGKAGGDGYVWFEYFAEV